MNEQEKYDWMVYVSCMTFNQAPYIVDAMNGFMMQETNFPFVCAIVDDASNDGEQKVIKNYLNNHFDIEDKKVARHEETDDYVLTFARHKTNVNCYFAVLYLKYNHYKKKSKGQYLAQWRKKAKYIAICEGDDYWIDSQKLQKQVNFMESNPEYGLCYTRCYTNVAGIVSKNAIGGKGTTLSELLNDNCICTLTTLFLNSIYNLYCEEVQPSKHHWKMGDYPRWLWMSSVSKIGYMDDITAVYRILPETASHTKNIEKKMMFLDSMLDIQLYFNNLYGNDKSSDIINECYKKKMYYSNMLGGDFCQLFSLFKAGVRNKHTFVLWPNCYYYLLKSVMRLIARGGL